KSRAGFNRLALGIALGSNALMAHFGTIELLLQARELSVGIGDVIETQWGERWLWRNLALIPALFFVLAAFAARGLNRTGAVLALGASLAYLAFTAAVSHAAAGQGSFWAAGSDFVHLVATSIWLGTLALVAVYLWRAGRNLPEGERYPVIATVLQRFSLLAVASVALLLFTGTFNTVVQISQPSDLLSTNYGNALLAKLLLLLPLLVIGAANAYLFRPDLVEEAESTSGGRARLERLGEAEQHLRKTMKWEIAVAIIVIGVVALLVQLTPTRGRIDSGESQGTFLGSMEDGGIFVTLEIEPRQVGNNTFSVYMAGAVEDVESVRLNFWPDGDSSQESRLILDPSNPPTFYLGQGANLGSPGRWEVQVFVRRAAGTGPDITLPFTMTVPTAAGEITTAKPGGAFAFPVSLTAGSAALLFASAVASVGVIYISMARPGLPGGIGTLIAEQVADRMPQIRPAWSLGVLVLLGVGLGMWIGSHRHGALSNEQATRGNPIEATADSVATGQLLFQRNCIQCHGETGRGDGPLAASLSTKPANLYDHIPYHPDSFFFSVITSGLGGIMPAFGDTLTEEERWHILNYMRATFTEEPATE
ncbi:MAG: CopD family protein, partial [Methylibium sp.]